MRRWENVVSGLVAQAQRRWERDSKILRLYRQVGSYAEVGRLVKMSKETVRVAVWRAEQPRNKLSPVEKYLTRGPWKDGVKRPKWFLIKPER